ncbi:MAG: serine/threonine-protein kinase [bacterium]
MKHCPQCHEPQVSETPECPSCGGDSSGAEEVRGEELTGLVIDRSYRLEEFVGAGAMGWVYRARHLRLGSDVAVKLLKPTSAELVSVSRFTLEARTASRLAHPHVIQVQDFGQTPGGLFYMVTEFLRGRSLENVIDEDFPLPFRRVSSLFNQLLAAVSEAHAIGLIHRDLKPENIVVETLRSGEDFVKVLDFGIARMPVDGEQRITMQGMILGTPSYMAPELIRGEEASAASDLYAMGMILFQLLTGRPAFEADGVMEMLSLHLHSAPPSVQDFVPEREIPDSLAAIVAKCLEKRVEDRFADTAELRRAFDLAIQHSEELGVPCATCHHRTRSAWSSPCTACPSTRATVQVDALDILGERPVTALFERSRATIAMDRTEPASVGAGLMGRSVELAAVGRFLSGPAGSLQVCGPVGRGKTSLLDRLVGLAKPRGLTVLRCGADPSLGRLPWHPVRQLLGATLGFDSSRPRAREINDCVAGRGLGDASHAALLDLFGWPTPGEVLSTGARMERVLDNAVQLLIDGAEAATGLCLLLDDADEYDLPSRRFVQRLLQQPLPGVWCVIAAETALLGGADGALLSLGPLSSEELAEWAQARGVDLSESPHALNMIHSVTQGNPLHIAHLLAMTSLDLGVVSGSLEDLIRMTVVDLSADAARLLLTVCLTGDRVVLPPLAQALPAPGMRAELLAELAERNLLEIETPDVVRLTHPYIGVVVREATPESARRMQHRRIYDALAHSGTDVLVRVRHAREAQLGEIALELLEQAAHRYERWLDDEGAALHYQHALQVAQWQLGLESDDPRVVELSFKLGVALEGAGHSLSAEKILQDAWDQAGDLPALRTRLEEALDRLLADRPRSEASVREAQRRS